MSEHRRREREENLVRDILKNAANVDRRGFFVSAGAFGATAAFAGTAFAQGTPAPAATAPATAPAEAPKRPILIKNDSRVLNIGATVRSGNYWNFTTFMTPVEEFYVRNHYPTPIASEKPILAKENWKLKIHGPSVERPIEIGYEDLLKMPSRTIIATMECHGNSRSLFWEQGGFTGDQVKGGNWVLGAVGQAEWQYVPMSVIFDKVGIKPNAKTVLFWSGVDGAGDIGRPMPYQDVVALQNDMGITYAMNGNPLTEDHGAPVRVVVPGWGGTASIKWLTEIKVSDKRIWTRVNTKGEAYIGPDYPVPEHAADDEFMPGITPADIKGPMVTWMPPKSFITVPLVLEKSPSHPANYPLAKGQWPKLNSGKQTMRGYAWAPRHGVKQVEYRVNGGEWKTATILPPNLGKYTWVRFTFDWDAPAGRHVVETRATDNSGYTQPESVPLNVLGMANGSIAKFKIEVV